MFACFFHIKKKGLETIPNYDTRIGGTLCDKYDGTSVTG